MNREDPRGLAVATFRSLEDQLHASMEYIPYVEQNANVVSPRLVPILMDACSLTESVFRHAVRDTKRHTLRSYADILEPQLQLEEATSLLLMSPLRFLRPFERWTQAVPPWWDAYNLVKHDRIANYSAASLQSTVAALAGLHQVLARSPAFLGELAKDGWFNYADEDFVELFAARAAGAGPPSLPVETKLFVSPTSDTFVDWSTTPPTVDTWEFSVRVKTFILEDEGW